MHNLWGSQCQATLICETAGKSGCLCNVNLFGVSVSGFSLCIFLVSVGSTVYIWRDGWSNGDEMVDNGKMVCIYNIYMCVCRSCYFLYQSLVLIPPTITTYCAFCPVSVYEGL